MDTSERIALELRGLASGTRIQHGDGSGLARDLDRLAGEVESLGLADHRGVVDPSERDRLLACPVCAMNKDDSPGWDCGETGCPAVAREYVRVADHPWEGVDPHEALRFAQAAMKRRMMSDDALYLPYDEDMADALRRVEAALAAHPRRAFDPSAAAVAATLVDLMKRNLPPHISESQQVEAYVALSRIARGV